ncbi:MAG: class B sortase [Lachnospiraceae bacterium]|nr:class B sortase [Lachnospiraceae bacterium]
MYRITANENNRIRDCLQLWLIRTGALVFTVSALMMVVTYMRNLKIDRVYEYAAHKFIVNDNSSVTADEEETDVLEPENTKEPVCPGWAGLIDIDFAALGKVNEDIYAWIYFENEDISYPVLWSEDDGYGYLKTSYEGKPLSGGSICIDAGNAPDMTDRNTVIYGHNMKNLSMFGRLKYYREGMEYYEGHQYFQILTRDGKLRYHIFSFYETAADSSELPYMKEFDTDEDFMKYAERMRDSSLIECGVGIDKEDRMVTLSTCTSDAAKRFVVQAVLEDEW